MKPEGAIVKAVLRHTHDPGLREAPAVLGPGEGFVAHAVAR